MTCGKCLFYVTEKSPYNISPTKTDCYCVMKPLFTVVDKEHICDEKKSDGEYYFYGGAENDES